MKKFTTLISFLFVVFVFISCSQNPSNVLTKLKALQSAGNYEDAKKYYTSGTVKAMEEIEKLSPKNESKKNSAPDKKFVKGTEWDVVSEKIDGDIAEVKVKFTAHPIENMKGLELPFRFSKEGGEWKIDMEKELKMSLEMIKMTEKMSSGGKVDFFNKMKEYMKLRK